MRCLAFVSALLGVAFAHAQEERALPVDLEFDLIVVQLSESAALPLIADLRNSGKASQARDLILTMVAKKGATLMGWPILRAKSGQRAVVEQILEMRYATQYDAPGAGKITQTTEPTVPLAGRSAVSSGKVATHAAFVSEGIPVSFETRNVGVTLEIEGTIVADLAIDLSLVPQHVRFAGFRKAEIEQKETGKKVVVEQPEFIVNKVTTSLTVRPGDTTLLGVFRLQEPAGHMELFILQTNIIRAPAAATPDLKTSPPKTRGK